MALSLPYEDVPDFLAEHDLRWAAAVANWAADRGYQTLRFIADHALTQTLVGSDITWIATGTSPRGGDHAVVYVDDKMIQDPHPSREGLLEITGALVLFPTRNE